MAGKQRRTDLQVANFVAFGEFVWNPFVQFFTFPMAFRCWETVDQWIFVPTVISPTVRPESGSTISFKIVSLTVYDRKAHFRGLYHQDEIFRTNATPSGVITCSNITKSSIYVPRFLSHTVSKFELKQIIRIFDFL